MNQTTERFQYITQIVHKGKSVRAPIIKLTFRNGTFWCIISKRITAAFDYRAEISAVLSRSCGVDYKKASQAYNNYNCLQHRKL